MQISSLSSLSSRSGDGASKIDFLYLVLSIVCHSEAILICCPHSNRKRFETEHIYFSLNDYLSSTISSHIGNLSNLKNFFVARTSLSGTVPESLVLLSKLGKNMLSGYFVYYMALIPMSSCKDCYLTPQFFAFIPCILLHWLYIGSRRYSFFGNVAKWPHFWPYHTAARTQWVTNVWTVRCFIFLHIVSNQSIPSCFMFEGAVDLSHTKFSGAIPVEIERLTNLSTSSSYSSFVLVFLLCWPRTGNSLMSDHNHTYITTGNAYPPS